jgi:hypothetical protein
MSDKQIASWTDRELDSALWELNATLSPSEATVRQLRAYVLEAANAEPTSRQPQAASPRIADRREKLASRRILVATGALLAAACLLTLGVVKFGDSPPPASADAVSVLLAAAAGTTPDPPPVDGQYRHIATHAWDMDLYSGVSGKRTEAFLVEHFTDVWEPASFRATWLLRSQTTGAVRSYVPTSRPPGVPVPPPSRQDIRATCGNFHGERGCDAAGTWQDPTQKWLDTLPRDPAKLYALLKKDAPHNSRGDAEYLAYAADALRSGLLPADLRVALYKALTRLHGLTVTQNQTTLDGRTGTALGINDGTTIQEIIVDSTTGQFIGERQVYAHAADGLPKGAVMSSSSVAVTIVSAIGAGA